MVVSLSLGVIFLCFALLGAFLLDRRRRYHRRAARETDIELNILPHSRLVENNDDDDDKNDDNDNNNHGDDDKNNDGGNNNTNDPDDETYPKEFLVNPNYQGFPIPRRSSRVNKGVAPSRFSP